MLRTLLSCNKAVCYGKKIRLRGSQCQHQSLMGDTPFGGTGKSLGATVRPEKGSASSAGAMFRYPSE